MDETAPLDSTEAQAAAEALSQAIATYVGLAAVAVGYEAPEAGDCRAIAQDALDLGREFYKRTGVAVPIGWTDVMADTGLAGVGSALLGKGFALIEKGGAWIAEKVGVRALEAGELVAGKEAAKVAAEIGEKAATHGAEAAGKAALERGVVWSAGKVVAFTVGGIGVTTVLVALGPDAAGRCIAAWQGAATVREGISKCIDLPAAEREACVQHVLTAARGIAELAEPTVFGVPVRSLLIGGGLVLGAAYLLRDDA